MDITFSLQNGQYIAEFKVTSEFNLHIEKGVGSMQMLQRTSGTFFDKVEDFKMSKGDVVYDYDSSSFIGEKTIKIVSEVEPTFAAVTTSGEVTEIKSQSKEVEVTANGTMDIIPDAGFSYLNSVKVKTNVATSGEGGGSENSMRYYSIDVKEVTEVLVQFYAANMKVDMGGGEVVVVGTGVVFANGVPPTNWKAVAVNVDTPTYSPTYLGIISFREQVESTGGSLDNLTDVGLTNITKEEFYNLNA